MFLLAMMSLAIFQHANIRTPRWLGYIVDHGKGIHIYNYSGLPIMDIVFGTFRNLAVFDVETSFAPEPRTMFSTCSCSKRWPRVWRKGHADGHCRLIAATSGCAVRIDVLEGKANPLRPLNFRPIEN